MNKFFLLLTAIFFVGCGPKEEASIASAPPSETASSSAVKTVDPASAGSVSGRVLFDGTAPEPRLVSVRGNPECAALHEGGMIASEELLSRGGLLQNAVVYIKEGLESYSFAPPAQAHVISNRKCAYVPHVSAAMVGQPVTFLNEDSTLHNIHSYPKNGKAFNLGLPLVGIKQTKTLAGAEVAVPLKCDVHPWMLGYLAVLPHPYFQVTGEDGAFSLKNLPAGDYVAEAWHEKLGVQTQRVTVTTGDEAAIEFKFTG